MVVCWALLFDGKNAVQFGGLMTHNNIDGVIVRDNYDVNVLCESKRYLPELRSTRTIARSNRLDLRHRTKSKRFTVIDGFVTVAVRTSETSLSLAR